ncbi:hypothetical protein B0H34DRAFT_336901 [Crassisporium funariophilum]|nr:hypothetical protein B0H34DRAFT_336901 [Crassisporium funariophilum]
MLPPTTEERDTNWVLKFEPDSSTTMQSFSQDIQPPAFKLFPELVQRILAINARMELSSNTKGRLSALTGMRYASYVCHAWREISLNSPSLWGKVIDLDQGNGLWRDELLRRTYSSPLHLRLTLNNDISAAEEFLISILRGHQWRIQGLGVWANEFFLRSRLHDLCDAFGRPFPILQSFCFNVWTKEAIDEFKTMVFPNLREFHLRLISNWHTGSSASHAIHFLRKTPFLESLTYEVMGDQTKEEVLPVVDLPYLRALQISGSWSDCADLLDHINPRHCCSLHLSAVNNKIHHDDSHDEELRRLQKHISRFAAPFFAHKSVTCLRLSVSASGVALADQYPHVVPPDQTFFDITIRSRDIRLPKIVRNVSVIDAFSTCRFDAVTTFHLQLDDLDQVMISSHAYIRNFLLRLPAVEVLLCHETLKHFTRLQEVEDSSARNGLFSLLYVP